MWTFSDTKHAGNEIEIIYENSIVIQHSYYFVFLLGKLKLGCLWTPLPRVFYVFVFRCLGILTLHFLAFVS